MKTPKKQIITVNNVDYDFTGKRVFEYRSQIVLWIKFKRQHFRAKNAGTTTLLGKKFYMRELVASMPQVMFRNTPPLIDPQKAIDRAVYMINNNFKGKFDIARIYLNWHELDSSNEWVERSGLLQQYMSDKQHLSNPVNFNSKEYLVWKEAIEQRLTESIAKADVVIDYPNNRQIHQRGVTHHPFV